MREARANHSLAGVGEDDDGAVLHLVLEGLDQVNQVGVLHLLRHQQVALVKLLHCANAGGGRTELLTLSSLLPGRLL